GATGAAAGRSTGTVMRRRHRHGGCFWRGDRQEIAENSATDPATQPPEGGCASPKVEGWYAIQELRVPSTQVGGLGDPGGVRRAVRPHRPAERRRQAADLRRADRRVHLPPPRPAEAVPV